MTLENFLLAWRKHYRKYMYFSGNAPPEQLQLERWIERRRAFNK